MITVVVTDDHHLVREGIRALIETADDMEVIGEAVDGLQAIELVQSLHPSVLVMDMAMPRLNGVQTLEQMQALNQTTKVVILSMYSNETLVWKALQKGAKAYLSKESVKEELLLAIRAADRGAVYLSPTISETILADVATADEAPGEQGSLLTKREIQLLQLISEGYTNSEMAKKMYLSIKTVERHRANLMAKLNAHNLVELIRIAIKRRLILIDE